MRTFGCRPLLTLAIRKDAQDGPYRTEKPAIAVTAAHPAIRNGSFRPSSACSRHSVDSRHDQRTRRPGTRRGRSCDPSQGARFDPAPSRAETRRIDPRHALSDPVKQHSPHPDQTIRAKRAPTRPCHLRPSLPRSPSLKSPSSRSPSPTSNFPRNRNCLRSRLLPLPLLPRAVSAPSYSHRPSSSARQPSSSMPTTRGPECTGTRPTRLGRVSHVSQSADHDPLHLDPPAVGCRYRCSCN